MLYVEKWTYPEQKQFILNVYICKGQTLIYMSLSEEKVLQVKMHSSFHTFTMQPANIFHVQMPYSVKRQGIVTWL